MQTVGTQIRMSGLIWIQAVSHSDSIPEIIFQKRLIMKKNQQMTKRWEKMFKWQRVLQQFQNLINHKSIVDSFQDAHLIVLYDTTSEFISQW